MKKVILMAAVAMLFATAASAQGKVTTTTNGTQTNAVTTCKKDPKCPNASQCQGKKVNATTTTTTANQGNTTNARANGNEGNKKGNATATKANVDGRATKIKPNTNNSSNTTLSR